MYLFKYIIQRLTSLTPENELEPWYIYFEPVPHDSPRFNYVSCIIFLESVWRGGFLEARERKKGKRKCTHRQPGVNQEEKEEEEEDENEEEEGLQRIESNYRGEGEKGGFTFPSIGYEDWIVEAPRFPWRIESHLDFHREILDVGSEFLSLSLSFSSNGMRTAFLSAR